MLPQNHLSSQEQIHRLPALVLLQLPMFYWRQRVDPNDSKHHGDTPPAPVQPTITSTIKPLRKICAKGCCKPHANKAA